jgi:BirA family transcriptional regulator, biotin operon repressor / biotin---[acetyl-CoA-carboxylase] ligase
MDDLSAARILAALQGTRFRRVEVHASLPSTQTLLASELGADGRVVVADHQLAGRGRAGRSWVSPPGRSLMFSVLLRGVASDAAALTSLQAGVAVARALAAQGADPRLKWPNDIQLSGRKAVGMLGELAPDGAAVVLGIGVNVAHEPSDFPPELEATSLRIETGRAPRRDDVLVAILRELEAVLADEGWLDEYRRRSATIGQRVRVELADGSFEGTASDVRDDGALIVDGRPVIAGDVVHLRPA